MKGKHLTRSHAMRESTSPPRTPTPRGADHHAHTSPNGQSSNYQQQHHHHHQQQQQQQQQHAETNDNVNSHSHNHSHSSSNNNNSHINNNNNSNSNSNSNSNNKLHAQSTTTRGNSPIVDTPAVIVTSQHNQQQQQNVALSNEAEFPKLSPPKSTKGSGAGGSGSGGGGVGGGSGGHRNNNNSNGNTSNSNGPIDGGNKMEYNNNKKLVVDMKSNASGNAVQDTHKNHNSNNNNNNKHQHFNASNASNALHQALNIADSVGPRSGNNNQQQQNTQSHYNSGMNYQLNTADTNATQQQQQQQQQHHQQHQQHHPQQQMTYDKENRCPRNDSQNSSMSNAHDDEQQHYERAGGGGGGGGGGGHKKQRANSNPKGPKPRLKNISSSSGSADGSSNSNNTSGFISRENSSEQFTDHGGTDLLSFFKETLNKSMKDRHLLLKIEKELMEFVQDKSRNELRFPSASSYNRMLIHRTAAFFGMEHNVDTETQQCVIVATTKSTRIPEMRFKSLVRDHREDTRKSILKRDTHSFDEARQSSYLCPDRGSMLDRKAKSFEEREEDYERARSRIFSRSQIESGECLEEDYVNWAAEQQPPQQQQQQHRSRPNGKMLKMQTSTDGRDGRDGRSAGAVPKAHSFGGYGGGPPTGGGGGVGGGSGSSNGGGASAGGNGGGAPLLRGESTNSNKSGGGRVFSKQDSAGSTNTPWRLSPSSSGYKTQTQSVHSDSVTPSPTSYGSDEQTPEPSISSVVVCQSPQLPATSALANAASSVPCGLIWAVTDITNVPKGSVLINPHTLQPILNQDGSVYHFDPSNLPPSPVMTTGVYHQPNKAASPQPQASTKRNKSQQMPQTPQTQQQNSSEDGSTGTLVAPETMSEMATQTVGLDTDSQSDTMSKNEDEYKEDICNQSGGDECDNTATGCLSITTTISTKNYDRIEVQKFKNQATSPNIPNDVDEITNQETSAPADSSTQQEQQPRIQQLPPPPPSTHTPTNVPQTQTQTQTQALQQHRETPHSARSTPFSASEHSTKRASEEPKAASWTYTQSYQAPDGSTMFHTTNTPNSTPYCTTTYQQGPDGNVYAIPQGMIYTYPPPVDGEVQGYFMPVFDPAQQRTDAPGIIPTGAQTVYPTAGGGTTMVPMAAAYPTAAQFATSNGTPIYHPGQVIYSSEQFTPGGAPVAAPAAPTNASQLQQIPMTTYPIGYPYPYNGYWGQTMTYYVPQQTLANAMAGAPLLPAPPPPSASAPSAVTAALAGQHVAGGVNLSNGIITATAAAGPTSSSTVLSSGSSSGNVAPLNVSHSAAGGSYQAHNGTTYFGTGRVKRPAPSHYGGGGHHNSAQVMTAIPNNGGVTTTYQLGHAMPTLTLAAAIAGAAAATNDLNGPGATAAPTATMYALPQQAALFPANMFPYAAAAAAAATGAPAGIVAQPHTVGGGMAVPPTAVSHAASVHAPQSNPVIAPFYAQPAQMHSAHVPAIMHPPGSAAIPIVDPATRTNIATGAKMTNGANGGGMSYIGGGNNTSQSAPSTPHSLSFYAQPAQMHSAHMPAVIHAPGSAAIPIVDPATMTNIATGAQMVKNANGTVSYISGGSNTSQSAPSTPHSLPSQAPQRNPPLFSTPPILGAVSIGSYGSGTTPYYYSSAEAQNVGGGIHNSPHNTYMSSHDKRNSHSSTGGRKSSAYSNGGVGRHNSAAGSGYNGAGKPPLLGATNETRSSPNSGSNGYQGGGSGRPHPMSKRGGDKPQLPLLSGPPPNSYGGSVSAGASYHAYHVTSGDASGGGKPPVRLNAAAVSFRQKPSGIEYRRSVSQRNSPGTNSSSNENSNNNSPNSIAASSSGGTPIANCYTASTPYMNNGGGGNNNGSPAEQQPQQQQQQQQQQMTAPASLYITARGAHIPPQMQHGGAAAAVAATGSQQAAATAAALGTYNPGAASSVYFKYGQTYFAHPSVALPNSRRSPSTDLRPQMAQMTGMYPTVNMMIPAPPRHASGRHPNPNYKGTRPR